MDPELLKACSDGDLNLLRHLLQTDPDILLSTTPQSNNCLHIAVKRGHDEFAVEVLSRAPSLLFATNIYGATPLILALVKANASLASEIITAASQQQQPDFSEMLLKVDIYGYNALHHAIRNDFPKLALWLLSLEPRIYEQDNKTPDGPMCMAARKGFFEVVEAMLLIQDPSYWGPKGLMDPSLLEACSRGDVNILRHLHLYDSGTLLSVTPQSNNCLHIAAMLGHDSFAEVVLSMAPSFLLFGTNVNGETPLILALIAGNASLASKMIGFASQHQHHGFKKVLLMVDSNRDNALHHAIRNGLKDLAVELLRLEPRLSEQENKTPESPMFMATRKRYFEVVKEMLRIPKPSKPSYMGPKGSSVLFAAVQYDYPDMINLLLEWRPKLAYKKNEYGKTVLGLAVYIGHLEVVKALLRHDPNLAYIVNEDDGNTPFHIAAVNGSVEIAKEIFSACPDSVYIRNEVGQNALHLAVNEKRRNFVAYVVRTPQLHCLINQADNNSDLPLHYAAAQCDPALLRLLLSLSNERHDITACNDDFSNAISIARERTDIVSTTKWKNAHQLLTRALPTGLSDFRNYMTNKETKKRATRQVKSLTKKYTPNIAVVAALLATITFAAAFTLPGGYSTDPSDKGLPVLARKAAFQLFLISDTIAMCCSLAVAILILATWEDLDSLLIYWRTTKALIWCACAATSLAFGTGLFTVIAPKILWLAILILILCIILPFFSKIIADWSMLMNRLRRLKELFQASEIPRMHLWNKLKLSKQSVEEFKSNV